MKKVFYFLVLLVLGFTLVGCDLFGGKEEVTLTSIEVITDDAKVTYEIGENFSASGIKVEANFSDDSKVTVEASAFTVDSSKFNSQVAGTYTITVSYTVQDITKTITYNVTVNSPAIVLSSIELDTTAVKKEFDYGTDFSSEGLKVTAKYSDNTSDTITGFKVDSSKYNKTQAGTYEITVSYTSNSITKNATYSVTVLDPEMIGLDINTENANVTFVIGDNFTSTGVSISILFSDQSLAAYAETDFVVDSSDFNKDEIGTYTIKVTLEISGKKLEGSYDVEVVSNLVTIKTIQDFLDMREYQNSDGINSKIYTLANDIDLTDVKLPVSTSIFTGSFDGKGYTIKNASYTQTSSKEGLMFAKVDGAVIKNVNFFACTVIGGKSETVAIIAGECNNTGATFENIEFSCCTVDNGSQNYAALLVGRNESKVVKLLFNNITVKNLTSVSSKQYVGCLVGDIIKDTEVIANNCDIDVTLSSANNISVFSGRNRGGSVTAKNCIVRVEIGTSTTTSTNQAGLFADGNATSTIVAENVVILKFKFNGPCSANADMIFGRNTNNAGTTLTNVFYVSEECATTAVTTGLTSITVAEVTGDWAFTTLKLDTENWEKDTNKIVKLLVASENTPSEGATVSSIKLITANVDKQFFEGETFSTTGLLATAIYSDGCVIAINDYTVTIKNSSNEVVSEEVFLTSAVGKYTVEISKESVSEKYEIHIVEETDITVIDTEATKVFVVGSKFECDDLVVFTELSDNTHELLSASQFTVVVTDSSNNVITEFKTAGAKYTVTVSRNTFTKTYEIEVVGQLTEDDTVVNAYVSSTNTTNIDSDNKLTFKTINDALDYFRKAELDAQVIKNVYISEGTYTEKITVDMPNVNFVGDTTDYTKVIVQNNTASGTTTLDETTSYGTDNSATVIITSAAHDFTAKNIFFKNTFDYNNSTLANKQALAVRCDADKAIFVKCGFAGNQDTLEAKTGRQYYYQCYIEGSTDFIFGTNATAVFESCTIKAVCRYDNGEPADNNGYVCAPKGFSKGSGTDTVTYNFVFMNCNFTSDSNVLDGSMSIARPWGCDAGVVLLSCSFNKAYSVLGYNGSSKSRYTDMSGNSPLNAFFYEYNSQGDGKIEASIDGVTVLTAEQASVYTLNTIFKAVNGQVEYTLGDWVVPTDPTTAVNKYNIVYYTVNAEEYTEGDTFIQSSQLAYEVEGNAFTGYKFTQINTDEEYYNSLNEEVTIEVALATPDTYTTKLFIGQLEVGTGEFVVKEAASPMIEVKTTLDASTITESSIDRGTSYNEDIFTMYGKTDGTAISVSTVDVKVGETTYTKTIKLTGGKATASATEAEVANAVKVVCAKDGKISLVASQKNLIAATKVVYLKLFTSDGAVVETSTVALVATDATEMSVVTFNVTAGTYYIGADTNGFQLYEITYSYEEKKPEMIDVTTTLNASSITESSVARGTTFNDGTFTVYGKVDGSAISASTVAVKAGEDSYTKTLKLTGGTGVASATEAELANILKVVCVKDGKISLVVSQKNLTSATKEVFLKLYGSDAVLIETSTVALAATDATEMSVVTFTVTAGTYFIGANTNGFQLYSASYTYQEVKPELVTVTLDAATITESSVARGTSFNDGMFTLFGKVDGTAISVSTVAVKVGENSYTKTIKLTGGTGVASATEAELANILKIVCDKDATITLVVSQKNLTSATKEVFLKLCGSDGTLIETSTVALAATDAAEMSVVTFTVKAGTYFIGANTNGFQLYAVSLMS